MTKIKIDVHFDFVQSVELAETTIITGAKQLSKINKIELIFNLLNELPPDEITSIMITTKLKEYDRERLTSEKKANRTSKDRTGRINRAAETTIETTKTGFWFKFFRGSRNILAELGKAGKRITTGFGKTYRKIGK